MNKKKNNKGFSLIELIIAIAILIILTGLLAPQFMKYIEKSKAADIQATRQIPQTRFKHIILLHSSPCIG